MTIVTRKIGLLDLVISLTLFGTIFGVGAAAVTYVKATNAHEERVEKFLELCNLQGIPTGQCLAVVLAK